MSVTPYVDESRKKKDQAFTDFYVLVMLPGGPLTEPRFIVLKAPHHHAAHYITEREAARLANTPQRPLYDQMRGNK